MAKDKEENLSDFNASLAVIVPVHNIAAYIRQCLDSLLAQTYPHWVAYVIDDGSTDESSQIVDEYAIRDSRFRVFHKQNGGQGSARNFALKKIASETQDFFAVTFLDGDDWLVPEAYFCLMHKMVSEDADILFFGFKRAFPDRLTEGKFNNIQGEVDRLAFTEAVFSYGDWNGKNGSWGVVWNKFFHTEVISGFRFIEDRKVNEDELFCMQAALRSRSFYFVNQSYYLYRQRDGSLLKAIGFDAKLERGRLLALSVLEASVIAEKQVLKERLKPAMLRTFVDARRKGLRQFFKDGKVFARIAEEVLPLAGEWHLQGNISDTDYRLIMAMVSMYKLNLSLMEGEVNTDFMSGLSLVGQLSVQFMSEEIEALIREKQDYAKNGERLESELKISRQREKEAEHSASLLQDAVTENKRLSADETNLKKVLEKQKQALSKMRSQIKGFRIGAYLKYKVLSKLTFGGMRARYRKKYQEQKRIYRAIRQGRLDF